MTMPGYAGPKYDGMPAPPTAKEIIAALRQSPEVMIFLRELRVTEYHFVAEFDDREPIVGGHSDQFLSIKRDCELLGQYGFSPFGQARSIRIFDAFGAVVWSTERTATTEAIPTTA